MTDFNYKNAWENKYKYLVKKRNRVPWETSGPASDLVGFVETIEMKKGCNVLDVGCGTGINAVYLASKGFKVTGVDISPTAISMAIGRSKRLSRCNFLVADVFQLPFDEDAFDLVYDRGCFHNIPHPKWESYIENIKRVLKENGVFLLSCVSSLNRPSCWRRVVRAIRYPRSLAAGRQFEPTYFSENDIRDIFSRDFQILHVVEMEMSLANAPSKERFIISCLFKNTCGK